MSYFVSAALYFLIQQSEILREAKLAKFVGDAPRQGYFARTGLCGQCGPTIDVEICGLFYDGVAAKGPIACVGRQYGIGIAGYLSGDAIQRVFHAIYDYLITYVVIIQPRLARRNPMIPMPHDIS